ncbi:MAG: transposase, partial [Thermodesulfovibrionales bacterium]
DLIDFKNILSSTYRWIWDILNYFIHRITASISEGINNKIKRLKHMAYGYKDVKYFLLKIHQHCGILNPKLST